MDDIVINLQNVTIVIDRSDLQDSVFPNTESEINYLKEEMKYHLERFNQCGYRFKEITIGNNN